MNTLSISFAPLGASPYSPRFGKELGATELVELRDLFSKMAAQDTTVQIAPQILAHQRAQAEKLHHYLATTTPEAFQKFTPEVQKSFTHLKLIKAAGQAMMEKGTERKITYNVTHDYAPWSWSDDDNPGLYLPTVLVKAIPTSEMLEVLGLPPTGMEDIKKAIGSYFESQCPFFRIPPSFYTQDTRVIVPAIPCDKERKLPGPSDKEAKELLEGVYPELFPKELNEYKLVSATRSLNGKELQKITHYPMPYEQAKALAIHSLLATSVLEVDTNPTFSNLQLLQAIRAATPKPETPKPTFKFLQPITRLWQKQPVTTQGVPFQTLQEATPWISNIPIRRFNVEEALDALSQAGLVHKIHRLDRLKHDSILTAKGVALLEEILPANKPEEHAKLIKAHQQKYQTKDLDHQQEFMEGKSFKSELENLRRKFLMNHRMIEEIMEGFYAGCPTRHARWAMGSA